MTITHTLSHDYPLSPDDLWADIVDLGALARSMEGELAYEGLPQGEAKPGDTHTVKIKRWGWLPLGEWHMTVVERDDQAHIMRSAERGGPVKLYKHTLKVDQIGDGLSRYTDTMEIDAGALTGMVAPSFQKLYAARHRARAARLLPDGLTLRPAARSDLEEASALCIRSKASWGYDNQLLAHMSGELTLTHDDLLTDKTQLAFLNGEMIGVAQVGWDRRELFLHKIFISERIFRSGVGRILYAWALNAAREMGADRLVIASDPGAVPFYHAMGALDDGEMASGSVFGRMLPRLAHTL